MPASQRENAVRLERRRGDNCRRIVIDVVRPTGDGEGRRFVGVFCPDAVDGTGVAGINNVVFPNAIFNAITRPEPGMVIGYTEHRVRRTLAGAVAAPSDEDVVLNGRCAVHC
jgi:hypothetical protein